MLFHVSLTLLLVTLNKFSQWLVQCAKSAVRLYFVVLVCLSFSWGQDYSILALNIVDSPILVFILIAPCQYEQVLPNLSNFDHSFKPKKLSQTQKSEKYSRSFVWKLISEPGCVFGCAFCANKNKEYIYI